MRLGPLPVGSLWGAFLLGFPALFSIVNPIGGSLLFNNVTQGRTHLERVALARRIGIYSFLVLTGSLLLGSYVLEVFGVSIGALRVAGGLVVAVTAWELLMAPEGAQNRKQNDAAPAEGKDDVAFFPLTMPLTTGPGSISVAIALASERPSAVSGLLPFFGGAALAALAVSLLVWMFYTAADRVLNRLGEAGAAIVSRLAAFLLLCIGVQIVSTGLESLLGPWLLDTARKAA
jgi:multiple antibiotic resistance protein